MESVYLESTIFSYLVSRPSRDIIVAARISENSPKAKAMNSPKSALQKNCEPPSRFEDPIVEEVREARHTLAARLDNDLYQIANDLMSRQGQLGNRLRFAVRMEQPAHPV